MLKKLLKIHIKSTILKYKIFLSEMCSLEPQEGPCRGQFKKWAFVPMKNMCIPFNYGGCRGNGNNFETEEECYTKCVIPHVEHKPGI